MVLRTRPFDGHPVRNHAKFLAIDHRFLLVTSANFSWSAEYDNVEFGVLIDNRNLAESVEREMRDVEDDPLRTRPAASVEHTFLPITYAVIPGARSPRCP